MNDGAPAERPRPQFGEYARPEEQAVRAGHPAPEIDPALVPQDGPPDVDPPKRAAPRSRLGDRVVTIALLAFGLYNVISGIGLYTDPSALLEAMRIGDVEFADYDALRSAGVAAIVVMMAGWLATTWFVWRRGSAGKSMWWIALLAGIVFSLVGALIVAIPFATDPNVMSAILEMQGIDQ
ncbi:DUF6264 family protein [Microbacterium karelineae]|uniref:DUF6264 family protein n=1 Tax=Microbacterium karelineae TaxID=2654283 RepID=UPI0018D3F793|nr:DUF6264 family protein [Microbacterium karelineae]